MIKQNALSDIEEKRVSALQSYNVLDTLPEKEYDAIAKLASYICGTPMSLISLIDADRQWVKSNSGIDVTETRREDAFCNTTILSDNILEINDTTQSADFKDNIYVTGAPHLRFYAGAPLIDPDGYRLGSLCVLDDKPHQLNDEQREALRTLANEVMSNLILRKQKQELENTLSIHREFHNLFDTSPELHCILDKNFNIQVINKAIKKLLGFEPADAINHPIWDFFTDESKKQSLALLKGGLAKQQRSFDIETFIVNKNGNERCISWTLSFNADKWYANGRDITDQKSAQNQLEMLSLVASKVSNGVVISNANDEVLWNNEAFEIITGFAAQDVSGEQLCNVIIKNQDNPSVKQLKDLMAEGQSFEADVLVTTKDGEDIWIKIFNSIIRNADGNIEKYVRVLVNINSRKRAEQDLEILSFASRRLPGGIVIRDEANRVLWMNEKMEDLIGYTFAEMQGNTFGSLLIGEQTDKATYEYAAKAVAEKQPYEVEIKIYRKDGNTRWVWISNSPMFNEAGEVDRQVGIMVDITERKKAEKELKMLSLVASSTTGGVIINDSEGNVEWINHGFEKITGYNIKDVRGHHLGDVVKGELTDIGIIERTRELSKNKQSFEVDLLIYRKDGQPLWISVINSVILDDNGHVDKYIEVIIDITAKKKVELELIAAKEEALQLSRAKDMFISILSHEMRTPLNAVIGMTHLLSEDNPTESQKENLGVLKFSADTLLRLINDVLDFTKIETGNVDLEKAPLSLHGLVQSVISSMQFKANEQSIYLKAKIDAECPDIIVGDKTRLSQILLNLINNAVKFTKKGGVNVDLKVIEQTATKVRIRFAIADTGIGIARDKINTIFESFKQAEADTTRKYGGTGLGLPITKRLVELHDSRINVDSIPGQGSTFWFTISFEKGDSSKNNIENIVETELNINVLVVDDNQINRLLVNKVLKKWGATADFAENGREAVDMVVANTNYDAVLMDIHMPEMGGIEATRVIRSHNEPYFQHLPIIALTASMLNTEIDQINGAGMNDYLLKPFDPKTLYTKLSRYQKQ